MTMSSMDAYWGMEAETSAPYSRYVDDEGWLWRVETDGRGRTVEHRERWVGAGVFDLGPARAKLARLLDRMERRAEQHPDLRQSVVAFLEAAGGMTSKELARLTGRNHQQLTDLMGELRRAGLAEASYTSHSEYRWELT